MDSKKYVIYREIFINVEQYNFCKYVASAYGFENLKTSNFDSKEDALIAIKKFIDRYINECVKKKIIYKKPTPPDGGFFESSRGRRDAYGVNKEECVRFSDSFFIKESNFALSAILNKVFLYREDGSFIVDFSKSHMSAISCWVFPFFSRIDLIFFPII